MVFASCRLWSDNIVHRAPVLCVCVFVVWDGEKENRDIDREGECRVGRALVSLASRPPTRVCKA